jgi:drug/metabolite transporter (DMT)-like permease
MSSNRGQAANAEKWESPSDQARLVVWAEGEPTGQGVNDGWIRPTMVALFVILNAPLQRRQLRPDSPEVRAMLEDEFRHANLARAQRLALIVVLVAQVPLAILVSGLATEPAVTVMAVASVTLAMTTLIASFLFFDRE